MSRVFLLATNTSVEPHPVYPLGMAVVASALTGRGHEVRQFDFLASGRSVPRLREAVAAFAPDFVGVSLRNLDDCDSLSPDAGGHLDVARELVAALRDETAAPILLGGPALSLLPEEILDDLGADYAVVGEGEHALAGLLDALAAGRPAARVVAGGEPLEPAEMVSPLWNPELIAFYCAQTGIVNYQTKRGCPHRCAYCSYPGLEGRRYRFREPVAVVDDLERLGREQGVDTVFFTDSVFNDAQGQYLRVAEEMLRRDLRLRWAALIRPEGISRSEFALLKRSGLEAVEFGTDAASDHTLEGLGKGFSFDDVVAANRACVEERLPAAHFVIFGGPAETDDTVREGLDNLARLDHCVVFAFSGIRLLPGTPLLERAVREGVISSGAPLLRPVYYFSPGVEPEAMNRRIEAAFRGRRDRIFPPSEGVERLAVMRRFGFRGLLWDKLVSFDRPARAPAPPTPPTGPAP
ncbi:MAG: lipid biosynthesis B12-binding/radical SAM protein [Deltaproteobacteria bacterium]|nr:lipid biosynthesis B12-binding/radical SAM protein [Deltaproteobacteria bacterium]